MASPLVGHLDPSFLAVVEELQEGLRRLFGTANRFTLPISATGSVILTKLIHEMKRTDTEYCLATMCLGGGQGVALIVKNEA